MSRVLDMGGPGFGWDSVVAPMGGHRVVAVAILLVALGVGALGAVAVRRRLGRLLGERPDQPYRALRSLTASGKAGVFFWALVIVAIVWLEVSGQIVRPQRGARHGRAAATARCTCRTPGGQTCRRP